MKRPSVIPILSALILPTCLALSGGAPRSTEPPSPASDTPGFPATPAATAAADTPGREPTGEAWPDAFAMNDRIGRGVNFGNALEAPSEGEWGVTLREEYFQLVKDAGFDSIRLPVRWNAHAPEEPPYAIEPAFFERVDWAVENALDRGLAVILDFHHFTDYMECAACERDRLLGLWTQIAAHYQGHPADLVFEVLNEPTDAVPAPDWNAALAAALAEIRKTNPERIVIAGPVDWNGVYALERLELPEGDRRLIATFHYYNPFPFTHQGAEWVEDSDAWLGTAWTGSAAERQAVRGELRIAAEWGRAHNRPILLGEFGAYDRADMESRARWTAFVAREAEAASFSWAYWEFCAGFGVYDPAAGRWREPLLAALLPDSPLLAG